MNKLLFFYQNYRYRMGLTSSDLEGYDDIIKQALSLNNASISEVTKSRI